MKVILSLVVLVSMVVSTYAQEMDIHHSYDQLLQEVVDNDGNVDYSGLMGKKGELQAYTRTLAENIPTGSWTKEESLAYWINSYNAHTLLLITENYPLSSIMDLHDGKTWDEKWIPVGGTLVSLNHIEHEIIRKQFAEPRIHFAVNCAAASCPPLLNNAYKGELLEGQLEERAHAFINNVSYNEVKNGKAMISKIFQWYKEDFGDLNSFLGRYNSLYTKTDISYKAYDWALNKQTK